MQFNRIEYTKGYTGIAYQAIANGSVVAVLDEHGAPLLLLDEKGVEFATESKVVEEDVVPPFDTEIVVDPMVEHNRLSEETKEQSRQAAIAAEAVELAKETMPQTVEELDDFIRLTVGKIIAESGK